MSLCYDFEKWIIVSMALVAVSLIVGLVLMQYAHGITEEQRQANREKYAGMIEEDIKKQDNGTTGCIDHNLCGTPSPEFADRRTIESTTPSLSLGSSVLLPSAFSKDTFNIDAKLLEYELFGDLAGKFPENYELDLSNSSIVCPSNDCKAVIKDFSVIVNEDSSSLTATGEFNIVDDGSNGHLTPKKRNLVEQSLFRYTCGLSDIQEDIVKKTTKYICAEPQVDDILRNFNNTHYPYTVTSSFELPSRHLVINAIELHQDPGFLYLFADDQRTVFRNESGDIEVK